MVIGTALMIAGFSLCAAVITKGWADTMTIGACSVLIAAGLVLCLGRWCHGFGMLDDQSILVDTAAAFFIASLLWCLIMQIDSLLWMTAALLVLAVLGCVLFLVCDPGARQRHLESKAALNDINLSTGITGVAVTTAAALWIPLFGCVYSFFSSGMSMVPVYAMVGTTASLIPKPVSYLIVLIVIVLALSKRGRSGNFDLMLFYRSTLCVATALLVVIPFVPVKGNGFFAQIVEVLGYLGFAMFIVSGWSATAMMFDVTKTSVDRACCVLMLCCGVGGLLGNLTVRAIGTNGQSVGLAVLALYLVVMTGFSLSARPTRVEVVEVPAPTVTAEDLLDVKCAQAAKRYALSTREEEVLCQVIRSRTAVSIAEDMYISPETVRTHIKRIYEKTGVHRREDLVELVNSLDDSR